MISDFNVFNFSSGLFQGHNKSNISAIYSKSHKEIRVLVSIVFLIFALFYHHISLVTMLNIKFVQIDITGSQSIVCDKCFRETLCQMSPATFFVEARSIAVINCTQSWIEKNFDVDEITKHNSSPCARNRLRKVLALLFHRFTPPEIPGAKLPSFCSLLN